MLRRTAMTPKPAKCPHCRTQGIKARTEEARGREEGEGEVTFGRPSREENVARRAAEKAANLAGLLQPTRSLHRGVMGGGTRVAVPKKQRRSDTSREALIHKGRLAALGCMVCRRLYGPHEPGPVELHHLRKDGWGKGDYRTLMPLCPDHHRGPLGVHGLGTKGFPKHYGFDQEDLLADALALLEKTP